MAEIILSDSFTVGSQDFFAKIMYLMGNNLKSLDKLTNLINKLSKDGAGNLSNILLSFGENIITLTMSLEF